MGLDKVIIDHLDEMEVLEGKVESDVDRLYKKLSIDELINDPEGVLMAFSEQVSNILQDTYFPEAAQMGIDFAQRVEKDGKVEIPDSNDPKLNEGLDD